MVLIQRQLSLVKPSLSFDKKGVDKMTKKQEAHCGSCEYNVNNYCMSQQGYYFYGEAISDEDVLCEDWLENVQSYSYYLTAKTK